MKKGVLILVLCLLITGVAFAQNSVRNVIYLIGDGMGLAQVSNLMIEQGYEPTSFDKAKNVALISTYSANNRVTDSAAAGTALATGHKTNNSMLGQTPDGQRVESIIAKATAKGMQTGIAVVCNLQHATPAAFYAHVASRSNNQDITRDMLSSNVDVLIGGGRKWLAEESKDGGSYLDAFARKGYKVVSSLEQTTDINSGRLLCAAAEVGLDKAPKRGDFLVNATAKGLEILANNTKKSKKGFVMMVEGSYIDPACHANDSKHMIAEMRDFEKTVAVAMEFADKNPGTLVIITADHETGGVTIPSNDGDFTKGESGVETKFSTGGHTGTLVPVYLYGTGAEQINGVMDNTDLAKKIMDILDLD